MNLNAFIGGIADPTVWIIVPYLWAMQYAKYVLLAIIVAIVIWYIIREVVVKPVKETAAIISKHRKGVHDALATLQEDYCIFDNVAVGKSGSIVAADRVIISPHGVLVIQEEYYVGIISGADCYRQWDIELFGHHGKMRNPIDRACQSSKELAEVIGIDETCILPIVVFPDETVLKTSTKTPVVNLKDLAGTIKGFQKTVFSDDDTQALIDRLDMSMLIGENLKEHV